MTTVSALLCRISGSAQVPFDGLLRGLCDILAARFGRSGGPRLACVAADEALPIGGVTLFALIADLLVTDAFVHAFPPGCGGRVSFTAAQEAWQLTVDDSGIAVRSHGDRRDDGPTITRQLVLRLGWRLEIPRVTGGTRCIVTIPRPEREGIDFGHPLLCEDLLQRWRRQLRLMHRFCRTVGVLIDVRREVGVMRALTAARICWRTAAFAALAGLGTLADYHSGHLDRRPSVGNRLGRRSARNEEK